MASEFFSQRITGAVPLAALGLSEIENPFCTDAYVTAMQKRGHECWIVGMRVGEAVQEYAVATLRRGRLSSTLEITSLPKAAQQESFWNGIYLLCRRLRVTDLLADTFFSPQFSLPSAR